MKDVCDAIAACLALRRIVVVVVVVVVRYLEQLITLFTCIDSVVPLYAARGQALTFLHAVEVAASQLHTMFEVRPPAPVAPGDVTRVAGTVK